MMILTATLRDWPMAVSAENKVKTSGVVVQVGKVVTRHRTYSEVLVFSL